MKEMIQLNLTEEESTILQSIVAVGVAAYLKDLATFERNILFMEHLIKKWPEANESLAIKMMKLVNTSIDLIETK